MYTEKEKQACQKKTRYANEPEAKSVLKRIMGRRKGGPTRTYKCPVCGAYHLTSSQKR